MPGQEQPAREATYSPAIEDMTTPGVVVDVDPDDAEAMGAFEEDALTEAEAWESNVDAGGADGE
jgi:hypothetical protein